MGVQQVGERSQEWSWMVSWWCWIQVQCSETLLANQ